MSSDSKVTEWTCDRCQVTAKWMSGTTGGGLPRQWAEENGEIYCLNCRRERAGEAAVEGEDGSPTRDQREQIRKAGTLAFEISRDPTRADSVIARACRTSAPAVGKARALLRS